MVIPIPKPNKDHADPNSYIRIALTSCLCKILECMINTQFIRYLGKSGILDRGQCGFRKHGSTGPPSESREIWLECLCTESTGGWSLLRPGEGLWNNLPVWYHQRPAQDGPQRPSVCLCSRVSWRPPNSSQNRHHSLWWILPGRCPNWWCIGCYIFGLKINELPSRITRDIFRALPVDDLAICFLYRSQDTIERHLQQAVNALQECATRNAFRFAAHKCKVVHFSAPSTRVQRPLSVRIGNTPLPVEESTKFLRLWWDSHLSFKKHIRVLMTECKEALNLIRVVAHLKWGRDRDTLLMLYQAIVQPRLDYGCIVYGAASNTDLHQPDSIHNAGVRLALGWFCTSPFSSMYTEANEAPLEERQLKLPMYYYLKTCVCTDNPAHHALHEVDPTIRDLYLPRPNRRGGMTRPPTQPIALKLEEAMISAEIRVELVCPLRTPSFSPGTHKYDPKKHNFIEGMSKFMMTREEAQVKFRKYGDAQGPHN